MALRLSALHYLTNKNSLVLSFKKEQPSLRTISGVLRHVAAAGYAALSRPTALWCFAIIPGYACLTSSSDHEYNYPRNFTQSIK
jgi:hypothetical protein